MWCFILTLLFIVLPFSKMDVISNQFCADMRPQSYVTIEQLLGMWYGVEIINHKLDEERLGTQYVTSCPVVHISEDHSPTVSPYYKGTIIYPSGTNYGSTYQDGQYQPTRNDNNQGTYYGTTYGQQTQYGRTTYRGSTNYQGRKYSPDEYPRRYADDMKRLRLLWTDNGGQVEYTVRYNMSKPGFWISSGPQNGSSLEPQYNQFAGTIQIIKAVGNHLVLTFCHRLPDQQLYTVILSRIPRLTRHEISDVHDLLTRRALETNNIKRVCYNNGSVNIYLNVFLLMYVVVTLVLKIV
ncbi:hypothetical protein ILUMI_11471 [Ignelater luminosus]|uniref:Uncharacterized protein n=1 Tax=Ignelater luminosus TaxID=2038154 RepID=A0A8K0D4X8_IGNLU|nr:hypothetical protein ILUMI_11471 [Ignelater luminosus]